MSSKSFKMSIIKPGRAYIMPEVISSPKTFLPTKHY